MKYQLIQEIICFARTDFEFDYGLKIWGFFSTFWFEFWRFYQIEITVFSNTRKKCEWRLNQNQLRNWNVWLWCWDRLCHLWYKNFAKILKDLSTSNNFTFLLFQVRKYVRYGRQTLYISNERRFSIFKWRVQLNI